MFICKFIKNNKYVAIDRSSGGYPYEVSHWSAAKFFFTKEEADHYSSIWAHSANKAYDAAMKVVEIDLIEKD